MRAVLRLSARRLVPIEHRQACLRLKTLNPRRQSERPRCAHPTGGPSTCRPTYVPTSEAPPAPPAGSAHRQQPGARMRRQTGHKRSLAGHSARPTPSHWRRFAGLFTCTRVLLTGRQAAHYARAALRTAHPSASETTVSDIWELQWRTTWLQVHLVTIRIRWCAACSEI